MSKFFNWFLNIFRSKSSSESGEEIPIVVEDAIQDTKTIRVPLIKLKDIENPVIPYNGTGLFTNEDLVKLDDKLKAKEKPVKPKKTSKVVKKPSVKTKTKEKK